MMADVSVNVVVSNTVNTQKLPSVVENPEVLSESKTDKVMEPFLLEDYDNCGKPESLKNLLSFLEQHRPNFSCCDLTFGLIYLLFLESGLTPEEAFGCNGDWNFDYRTVIDLSKKLPNNWKCKQMYKCNFILPPFATQKVKLSIVTMGDEFILNCIVDSKTKYGQCFYSTFIDPRSYFVIFSDIYKDKSLQNLKHLSLKIKNEICFPVKIQILRENNQLRGCFEKLPEEILMNIAGYLKIVDLINLGRTNFDFNHLIKTPKLWYCRLRWDYGVVLKNGSTYEELNAIYKKHYLEERRRRKNNPFPFLVHV